ncbi:MAG: ATP--guanido phosphotransferase [bacterium]
MTGAEIAVRPIPWLDASGPEAEVVVSSRARLARNLCDVPFPHRADSLQSERVFERVVAAVRRAPAFHDATVFDFEVLTERERSLLVERRLATPRLAKGSGARGVVVSRDESVAVLVNEEDHVRIQSIVPGLDLPSALTAAVDVDRALEGELEFAADRRLGYRTACPTNVGTGLRLSVQVHLPLLVWIGEVKRVHRAVAEMGMVLRGWLGEGSRAQGDLYQLSNQRTLGVTEEECSKLLERVVRRSLELQRDARDRILAADGRRSRLEDRLARSWAILRSARLLSDEEAAACLSDVWSARVLGVGPGPSLEALRRLLVGLQPAHLAYATEGDEPLDRVRARRLREFFAEFPEPGTDLAHLRG